MEGTVTPRERERDPALNLIDRLLACAMQTGIVTSRHVTPMRSSSPYLPSPPVLSCPVLSSSSSPGRVLTIYLTYLPNSTCTLLQDVLFVCMYVHSSTLRCIYYEWKTLVCTRRDTAGQSAEYTQWSGSGLVGLG